MRTSFLFFFFVSFSIHAQQNLTMDQQKVQQTVTGFFQGLADRDSAAMLSYCTDDILVLESGLLWTRDTLKVLMEKNTAPDYLRINTIDFVQTTLKGKIAWVSFFNQAEVTKSGRHIFVKWLETAILVRDKNKWKIQLLHSSLMERKE